ncbi:MAG: outer membrane lipoprotein-sorting protein [Hyphomicrobiales bacterium]|nr:outer membrane lipoprotein-sorting protein [Rickettsiales bacterium]MCP5361061.1 outer membrane lipoprotein-sorting protein [Hyphomicrobiales bacterium]
MRSRYILTILLALLTTPAWALSVEEIVAKANHAAYYQGKDGRASVHMVITDAQGRERTRDFTILRTDTDDKGDTEQKFYVYFSRPADVNKTAFLVWKHTKAEDDRWLYLPALDLVKRIAASDERTSFVGSHFFYEDVSGRTPSEDTHTLVEETDNFYVLKSVPKKKDAVEFAYYKNWIHKTTFIPVKTEFYDSADTAYRTYEALKVDTIDGHATVTQSKMSDKNLGGYTVMEYGKVGYDIGLPEDIFTERYLRAAPRKYLR